MTLPVSAFCNWNLLYSNNLAWHSGFWRHRSSLTGSLKENLWLCRTSEEAFCGALTSLLLVMYLKWFLNRSFSTSLVMSFFKFSSFSSNIEATLSSCALYGNNILELCSQNRVENKPLVFWICISLVASRCVKQQRTKTGNCPKDIICPEDTCQGRLGMTGQKVALLMVLMLIICSNCSENSQCGWFCFSNSTLGLLVSSLSKHYDKLQMYKSSGDLTEDFFHCHWCCFPVSHSPAAAGVITLTRLSNQRGGWGMYHLLSSSRDRF